MVFQLAQCYLVGMTSTVHTFEVIQTADDRFAVFVNGVRIADHASETEALAHCERLRQQSRA
jgi:hypothetical protein